MDRDAVQHLALVPHLTALLTLGDDGLEVAAKSADRGLVVQGDLWITAGFSDVVKARDEANALDREGVGTDLAHDDVGHLVIDPLDQ